MKNKFFIEIDSAQMSEHHQSVSGDVYLQRRYDDRLISVLCDGAGSGIKANVVASVVASMVISYPEYEEPAFRNVKTIIETFARGGSSFDTRKVAFTVVDFSFITGNVTILEYENPPVLIFRDGKIYKPHKIVHDFKLKGGVDAQVTISRFESRVEDRVVVYSDGVTMSGVTTKRLPDGWGDDGLKAMICESIELNHNISATELCEKVISTGEKNDLFIVKNDMSCASLYFRKPRKILICTGAPFDAEKDKYLAKTVDEYSGNTIICGGTTSQIVARELGREINVILKRDPSGLPPVSSMEGITLITEGILTLGKVKILLENLKTTHVTGRGTDSRIVKMLLQHDVIEFIVGTRINSIHQDPNLPIELETRRNVVKEISRLLEDKFFKKIRVDFI